MSSYHSKYTVELPPFPGTLKKEKGSSKYWSFAPTEEQVKWLKKALRIASSQQIARMMGVSDTTVYRLAMKTGASPRSRYVKVDPFPGELHRGKHNDVILTDEQIAWLKEWYPKAENGIIQMESGISCAVLHRLARLYGCTKSKKGISAIRRRNSKYIKKKLEGNGWYQGLRGHAPSENCQNAAAEWRKEHGSVSQYMKRTMPKKWKKRSETMSKAMKKQFRMERFRIMSGMKKKTKLHAVLVPFTSSQTNRRTNALKKGYWYYEDSSEQGGERWNIYWDKDTQRSAIFEANCEKAGFHIKDGRNL